MKTTTITLKTLTLAAASVALTPPAEGAFPMNIETVLIEAPNSIANAPDTTGFGSVGYDYRISKYEVTQGQWVDFLNAVATDKNAAQDILDLYSYDMDNHVPTFGFSGIRRSDDSVDPNKWHYSLVESAYEKRPVVHVSLLDAKRFCNWLTNGGAIGSDTEDGIYTLSAGDNAVRNTIPWGNGAVALPTENEWYKAAYYDPAKSGGAGYYTYAFGGRNGDTISHDYANYYEGDYVYYNTMGDGFGNGTYYMNEVDFFEGYASAYGAVDMTGNVFEWTDTRHETYSDHRVIRGGAYDNYAQDLSAGSSRPHCVPDFEPESLGFRVASLAPIPEPAEIGVIGGALVGLLCLVRRKRRAVAP
jgi:formylglycine-generating enzyme required for sulfatase activity